jgi:uncharacterized protein YndB with AHSA1/START domain
MREFDHSLTIAAPATRILDAFFTPDDLSAWWHVSRSLCLPRALGSYAVEWEPTAWRDDLLGRLGGAFRGTVIEFKPGREFFVADSYYLPPDGEPIGPMAFEVTCTSLGDRTVLRVRQSGCDDSARWSRYYDRLASNLTLSLDELKTYLEPDLRPAGA